MANLDIGSGSGTFHNIVKWNARDSAWSHRSQQGEETIEAPTMVMDLKNIALGWAAFREGQAPSRVFDPKMGVRAQKEHEDQKRCFAVLCFATQAFDGLAELCSTSVHLGNSIRALYAEYSEANEAKAGKLPVVAVDRVESMADKFGTNFKPIFKIINWSDRPEGLPDEHPSSSEIGTAGNGSAPAPAVAKHVPPPTTGTDGSGQPLF